MNKIYGETVKAGFVQRLVELFPNVYIFKEKEDEKNVFPNIFINQLDVQSREDRANYYFWNYFIELRYREVADIATEPKLQQKLDKMGFELLGNLKSIPINGRPVKLTNCRYDKVDNVLHFYANVMLQTTEEQEKYVKMNKIEQKTNLV